VSLFYEGVFMTQKDAVYCAIVTVLTDAGISFDAGTTDVAPILTRELRSKVNAILVQQFSYGSIELSDEAKSTLTTPTKLKAYVSGLVSNWIRKDVRLNGGHRFTSSAKSSAGFKRDPQLKALHQLYSAQVDENKRNEIQAHIDRRVQELQTVNV
jgi:hypothetical protein